MSTKATALAPAVAGTARKLTKSPRQILQSAMAALSEGRIWAAVEQFDENLSLTDHALRLQFAHRQRLTEFLEKSRKLFPDATLEVVSLFESENRAVAEWKLTATQTVPFGSISYCVPISFSGSTIVQVENGKIVRWSDYYDQESSRRSSLAALFREWVDY